MKHDAALNDFSGPLVLAAEQDVAARTHYAMLGTKSGAYDRSRQEREIVDGCADRWAARLDGPGAGAVHLILALLLHKYGWDGGPFAVGWRDARGRLAEDLPEGFARTLPKIESLLATPPRVLARKPSLPPSTTQVRAADLIAIAIRGRFFAAFVHEVAVQGNGGQYPIIEFFDRVFPRIPRLGELEGVPAMGERFDDGSVRRSRYAVSGLQWQPDPAGQVVLLQSGSATRPSAEALAPSVGLYTVEWFHRLPALVDRLFGAS